MKNLIHKKWFRYLIRFLVGGITLLVLTGVWFNWWAAHRKNETIAMAKASGIPLTLGEFTTDMPPPSRNFARAGVIGKWEDALGGRREAIPSDIPVLEDFNTFGDELFRKAWRRSSGNPPVLDFTGMPEGNPYGRSAATFLEAYDRRNAGVLSDLRESFALPDVRRPLVPEGFTSARGMIQLSEGFGMKFRYVFDGLLLRALAALEVGDAGKAAESIELGVRLSEMVGSRRLLVSVLIETVGLRTVDKPLKQGIERHQWKEADLVRIQNALRRLDLKSHARSGAATEVLLLHVWEGWKNDHKDDLTPELVAMAGKDEWLRRVWTHAPGGWFDLNVARVVESAATSRRAMEQNGPLISWWNETVRMKMEQNQGFIGKYVYPIPAGEPHLIRCCVFESVGIQLRLTTCELERYFLVKGRYPETLDELPAEMRIDPLHGTPFIYRVKDGKFTLYSTGPNGIDDGNQNLKGSVIDRPDWAL